MIQLKFIEVIVFYEIPQVFVATDIFGANYLCLLYPHDDESCYKYLAVRISEKRLNLFKGQIIDLLSIYKNPEDNSYFDVAVKDANDIIATPLKLLIYNHLCYQMKAFSVIMTQLIMKS